MTSTPEPARQRLDIPHGPLDVVRAARGRERLVALLGDWHQGEALIAYEPSLVLGLDGDPFAGIDLPRVPDADDTFGGGWIGLWGYRLGSLIERLPDSPPRPQPQPDHVLGFYDHVLRLTDGVWWAEGIRGETALAAFVADLAVMLSGAADARAFSVGEFAMTPTPDQHRAAVGRVVEHVAAGDIFQANLCARLEAEFTGDPLDLFCRGVETLAPAYAAFVSWPDGAVSSFSPELFLRRMGDELLTSPIKGTAPLDSDPNALVASAKDRAENVMIVDLMRNDLGRVSTPGSVRVPAIARVERHAVLHLVSDVVGHLAPGLRDSDLLRATFPPGSVTGAPKVRAMEIIAEQEATGREAYTGAIGHVSPCLGVELNVVIRTFEFARGSDGTYRVWLGVGGGIVADSDPDAEFAECLVKARPLIDAIGGVLDIDATPQSAAVTSPPQPVTPFRDRDVSRGVFTTLLVLDGRPIDLEAHVARLDASVRALWGETIRAGLEEAVRRKSRTLSGHQRLRVEAVPTSSEVDVTMTATPLTPATAPWRLTPLIVAGGIGSHKWVDRHGFGADDLIIDADGSVLETGRANLFVVLDDGVHTPPLDGRILPGTARARVIEQLREAGIPVVQRRLTTQDLVQAAEVFASNTLRGVVPVVEVAGVGSWPAGPVAAALLAGGLSAVSGENLPDNPPPGQARVLLIDNYDSFVYNLAQYLGELGARTEVVRNDAASVDDLVKRREAGEFSHLIISPGPGAPRDAGVSVEAIRALGATTPILGVCLGHQAIGEAYGAEVVRAPEVVHGKPSLIHHDGLGVFAGLPSPLTCARYHSLVVAEESLPADLSVSARTASGIVMGLRHADHPVEGVQMHPESILTKHGHDMLATFLRRDGYAD